jgi:hypothetical protein
MFGGQRKRRDASDGDVSKELYGEVKFIVAIPTRARLRYGFTQANDVGLNPLAYLEW